MQAHAFSVLPFCMHCSIAQCICALWDLDDLYRCWCAYLQALKHFKTWCQLGEMLPSQAPSLVRCASTHGKFWVAARLIESQYCVMCTVPLQQATCLTRRTAIACSKCQHIYQSTISNMMWLTRKVRHAGAPCDIQHAPQVVAGIIERAQNAATAALSDNRSARSPATLDSRPGPFAQLQNSLRSQRLAVGPAQQENGQAGAQSAIALPAAMQNLPSDAVQYIMSGILGRWFRQHSPNVGDSTPSVPSSMPGQHPHEARQSGTHGCTASG